MSAAQPTSSEVLHSDANFKERLKRRNRTGRNFGAFFYISNFVGLAVLIVLILHVLNSSFGLTVVINTVEPAALADRPLEELSEEELDAILVDQLGNRVRVIIRDRYSVVPNEEFVITQLRDALSEVQLPEGTEELTINELTPEQYKEFFNLNLSREDALDLVITEVVKPRVFRTWTLLESLTNRAGIEQEVAESERLRGGTLEFRSWISLDFITSSVSSSATTAGLRTALFGSFLIIIITATSALIVGVAAAVYLEEYAADNWLNNLIEINIRNLAAIPSIIYGMLGLAVLAQAFAIFTGGYMFGVNLPPQAADQVVNYVNTTFGLPALSNAERDEIRNAAAAARRVNLDAFVGVIVEHIRADELSAGEKEALARKFLDYRLPSLASLTTFSTPSIERTRAEIVSILGSNKLSSEQVDNLAENLRLYGTFNINGRTVLSAGLTLGLLILPVIIVNAQEALRAVPSSIREASYGLGATRWQTTSRQVLPAALPGIMTGVILAISRAIGETAPLLVVGASTFIGIDPNGPFSKFTVVPIQIYQWTSRPEQEFRAVAAAAIIVLLVVMLTMNALAIFVRQRYTIRY